MRRETLRAGFSIVEPIAMMRVQNNAGSQIKRDCAQNSPQADIRSVCIICTSVDNILADAEHCVGLSAIAEILVV